MMQLFNSMVKKMKDGGGVTFDIAVKEEEEELLATTLERRDTEEGDDDNESVDVVHEGVDVDGMDEEEE
jgi:hypothetical protein